MQLKREEGYFQKLLLMLDLKVISPEKEILSRKVDSVELPGSVGRFVILNNHAPIITSLQKGFIIYKVGEEITSIEVSGGFAEVKENVVTVCVEQ